MIAARIAAVMTAIIAVTGMLGGCASLPDTEDADGLEFAERLARLDALEAWDMSGRITVETPEEDFRGNFNWSQAGPTMNLQISGPLGAGRIMISGSQERLTFRQRRETLQLHDPERDLSELLGWWLPVTSLNAWLKGQPDDRYDSELSMSGNSIAHLEQRQWSLDYESYQLFDDLLLPRSIAMGHEQLRVTVTVDRFNPLADAPGGLN